MIINLKLLICGNLWINYNLWINNSQVHAETGRFGEWGILKAVPLHREKPPPVLPEGRGATRQGQRLKTGPYTTKALPENISNLVLPLGGVSGGLMLMLKYQIYKSMLNQHIVVSLNLLF